MKYTLNTAEKNAPADQKSAAIKKFLPFLKPERKFLALAFLATIASAGLNLASPAIMGRTIDRSIAGRDFHGVLVAAGILLIVYILSLIAGYLQTRIMGGVGQRTLYNLRNTVFDKLQELPVAFFNQNKAGDLISRINNDTENLNQFFSQALVQFASNIVLIIGAAIFVISLNPRLGAAALAPAVLLLIFSALVAPYVRKKNAASLASVGLLSAEVQESLENFKVIVAFNRRDYFREKFAKANNTNYEKATRAGIVNTALLTPVYGLISSAAQLVVLTYGIFLIMSGYATIGILISFIGYVSRFYDPLRHLAMLYAQFQVALGSWQRIADILEMKNDMEKLLGEDAGKTKAPVLEFKNVGFGYENGKQVLNDINFALEAGKTYALVGPTGGGKTTTASIMARLYDPTSGTVFLHGRDIRTVDDTERSRAIGFILQDAFLFTGTVRENIVYGNAAYETMTSEELAKVIEEAGLTELMKRFNDGLETKVENGGATLSLGQRQLIAFIRAVLRKPDILILDEATANIDTVTEELLQTILEKLPKMTTRVVIAHRLNTIESADEIFFVNAGVITPAGSFEHAVEMLMKGKKTS